MKQSIKYSCKVKSVVAGILFGCMTAIALPAVASTLRVAVSPTYPPFCQVGADGKPAGFDVDIAKALCKQMKMECQIQATWNWSEIIPDLKADKFDAVIASMSATRERSKEVQFTKPYYENPVRFIRQKGSNAVISKEGLKGKTIGVQKGTTFETYAFAKLRKLVEIKVYNSESDIYADLQAGKIQLTLGDSLSLEHGFLRRPEGANFEFFGHDANNPLFFGTGLAIAVHKDNKKLAEKINKALSAIRRTGEYQKISREYFQRDIYFMEKH